MAHHAYQVTEIVGTSPDGVDQAIRDAVDRAMRTIGHPDWFEVTEVRGQIEDGRIQRYEVGVKVGFRLARAR